MSREMAFQFIKGIHRLGTKDISLAKFQLKENEGNSVETFASSQQESIRLLGLLVGCCIFFGFLMFWAEEDYKDISLQRSGGPQTRPGTRAAGRDMS